MFTKAHVRTILLVLIVTVPTGCRSLGLIPSILFDDVVGVQLARVMDTTVKRELHFVEDVDGDGRDEGGPSYAVSLVIPEAWVYAVRTHINGPTLLFEHLVDEELSAPIFVITALFTGQYEVELERDDSSHGGPWFDGVLAATDDTVFVWTLFPGPTYSDLTVHEYATLQADVPAILESVEITPLDRAPPSPNRVLRAEAVVP